MLNQDGPTLQEYVDIRVSLLHELIEKIGERYDEVLHEKELRLQQRFEASEKYVKLGFDSAEKAIIKAEAATTIRFEGVNEFRSQLNQQQLTYIPRSEVMVIEAALQNRIAALEKQLTTAAAERRGISGGWGYAVGLVGTILALGSIWTVLSHALK